MAVSTFIGQYNEGPGTIANGPFSANTSGVLGMQEIAGILKQIYDGQRLGILYYKNNPAFSLLAKKEDFYGETYPLPVMVETPTGIANVFANAQLPNQLINSGTGTAGNLGPANFKKFMLTRASVYGVHVIDRQAMLSATNNIGAFVNGQVAQMDGIIQGVTNLISQQIYRSGSGSIGQIQATGSASSTLSAGQIQLQNPTDVRYFTVGQIYYATDKDPTQGVSATQRTGVGYLSSINRSKGILTFGDATSASPATTPANLTGWVNGDYVFISGTSPLNGPTIAGSSYSVALTGFTAWIGSSQTIASSEDRKSVV